MLSAHTVALIIAVGAGLAAAVPLLTELFKMHWMPRPARVALGLVIAAAGGLGTIALTPATFSSPVTIIAAISAVWAAAQVIYRQLWKPLGVTDAIGAKTGSTPTRPTPLTPPPGRHTSTATTDPPGTRPPAGN